MLKLTLSSMAVSVLHIDPLPPPDAASSPLGPMTAHFFSTVGPGHLAPDAFLQSRTVFNQACPYDHLRCTFIFHSFLICHIFLVYFDRFVDKVFYVCLICAFICRFVGQGLKINYEHCQGSSLRTFSTDVSLNQMEFMECLFPSEAVSVGSQRGIQYTEVRVSKPDTSTFCSALSFGLLNTLHLFSVCLKVEASMTLRVFHTSFSVTLQLLTFDTTASAAAPLTTCLHLLYKQAERRGPQVTAFISLTTNT